MPAVTMGTLIPGGVHQGHLTLGHSLKPWRSLSLQLVNTTRLVPAGLAEAARPETSP